MQRAKIPPGPWGLLFLGHAWQLVRDPLGFAARCARTYGDVVCLRFGPLIYYMFSHPDAIEYVLRGNHRNFSKDKGTHLLSSVLGQGLVTSEGELWRRQRRLAQPAFQLDQIQRYGPVMVGAARRLLDEWRPGQTRDIHADMMRLTLDIVTETLFSSKVSERAGQVGRALEVILKFFAGPVALFPWLQWLPTPGNRRYRRALRELDSILQEVIAGRRAGGPGPEDLLTRLLNARDEDGSRMSDRQLRDELATLFLAGHETTAVALSFCFYLLARHPQAEARLAAELEDVLQGQLPAAEHVPRLRYTEWVVREAMRLYPPVPSIGREALNDCDVAGYPVRKGTQITLVQWVVHRDPRWFDDPEAFRPERWDNDLARRLPRGAYFPFGDGPRVCIGQHFAMMEAVLILATVASRYRLALAPGYALELFPSITLRPKRGLPMVLHEAAGAGRRPEALAEPPATSHR
jgi:cytochrome P450